jgi:hypothetical protein
MLHGREYSERIVGVNPPMGRASGPPMGALLGAGRAFSSPAVRASAQARGASQLVYSHSGTP